MHASHIVEDFEGADAITKEQAVKLELFDEKLL